MENDNKELVLPDKEEIVPVDTSEEKEKIFIDGVLSTFGQKEDSTLSEVEKKLPPRRMKFIKELFSNGYDVGLAATNAGFSPVFGAKLMHDPQVRLAIVERLNKMNVLSNLSKDWVILEAVELYKECKKQVPVYDKFGEKILSYKVADVNGAWRGLENLANWLGMDKNTIEVGGTGKPIEVIKNEVKLDIMNIAELAVNKAKKKLSDQGVIDVQPSEE